MLNFINFLIEFQNKILKRKTNPHNNKVGFGATLCLNTKISETKNKIDNDVKNILKKYKNNPKALIRFIEKNNTKIYYFKNAKKLFNLFSQEIGFIPETKGLRALILNLIILKKTKIKTDAMLILDKDTNDTFWLIQQFYKWYAMKLKMPGYDANSQESFNSFLYNNSDDKIKKISIDEILDIKNAIARDVESINFILELAKSTVDSKKASDKICMGGAVV